MVPVLNALKFGSREYYTFFLYIMFLQRSFINTDFFFFFLKKVVMQKIKRIKTECIFSLGVML